MIREGGPTQENEATKNFFNMSVEGAKGLPRRPLKTWNRWGEGYF